MVDREAAPGWAAIETALREIYGDQEPRHWGPLISWALGGPDPLDGISCYEAGEHWHYVGFGLSELYEKESGDLEHSGFGFELTFRLARRPRETQPPIWPLALLQNLARYVVQSGNRLTPGDHMDANGPIALDEDTELVALLFAIDPELGRIDTPNGRIELVQIVGITADELDAVKSWHGDRFLSLLRDRNPRLVTDIDRRSVREAPDVEHAIQAGIERDGSSHGATFTTEVHWTEHDGDLTVTLGAIAVPDLHRMLRGRIPFGRPFALHGRESTIVFRPVGTAGTDEPEDDGTLFIDLTGDQALALREAVRGRAGSYRSEELPGLELVVEPTEIRDADGNVVEVIG